ncbi:hypothetical protein [Chitinimonas naiadis]
MNRLKAGLWRLLLLTGAVLAMLAAYSLVTTLWRQWAYGGDAYGAAWHRIALQAVLLLLGMLVAGWAAHKAKPPA